ncbi:MAG: hypothetical protein Q4A15_11680 [Prevotellaceae bacterium]|nr:hypothetical protein [Prevotellaceae bacterium]
MKIAYNTLTGELSKERIKARSHISSALIKFVESENRNMCMTFDTPKEAKNARANVAKVIKRLDLPIRAFQRGLDIYVIRKDDNNGRDNA